MTLPLLERMPVPPPRLALGDFPSPLEEHPALATTFGLERLVIKRDDLNGAPFGGNKLRALEWLLPAMGQRILTMGGYGSTWCAALAAIAAQRGQQVHAALFPQPWSPTVAGVLATTLGSAQVTLAGSRAGFPFALMRAWRGSRASGSVTWIPAGGATPLAVLGSVNAALEVVRQLDALSTAPQAVVVPLGSGGTAAGLLVGAWLAGWDVDICAVRVTDPWFAHRRRVLALAGKTMRLLHRLGVAVSPGSARLRVLGAHLGRGYGHSSGETGRAALLAAGAGLTLDVTYGAKAFAALESLAASFRRICFWHTFDRRLVSQHAGEHPLLRAARGYAESLWPQQRST